jgi:hypothetical protein
MDNTHTDLLLYGVSHNGQVHYRFTVGLPLMRHTYEALDETEAALGTSDGNEADLYYRMALLARSLIALGDIPKEDITGQLLLDGLTAEDYDRLKAATDDLKKKRILPQNAAPGSASSPLPSDDAASANNK